MENLKIGLAHARSQPQPVNLLMHDENGCMCLRFIMHGHEQPCDTWLVRITLVYNASDWVPWDEERLRQVGVGLWSQATRKCEAHGPATCSRLVCDKPAGVTYGAGEVGIAQQLRNWYYRDLFHNIFGLHVVFIGVKRGILHGIVKWEQCSHTYSEHVHTLIVNMCTYS